MALGKDDGEGIRHHDKTATWLAPNGRQGAFNSRGIVNRVLRWVTAFTALLRKKGGCDEETEQYRWLARELHFMARDLPPGEYIGSSQRSAGKSRARSQRKMRGTSLWPGRTPGTL
jgi:hypothetical protein